MVGGQEAEEAMNDEPRGEPVSIKHSVKRQHMALREALRSVEGGQWWIYETPWNNSDCSVEVRVRGVDGRCCKVVQEQLHRLPYADDLAKEAKESIERLARNAGLKLDSSPKLEE